MSDTPAPNTDLEATQDEFDAMPYETLLLIAQADSVIMRSLPTIEKMPQDKAATLLRKMIRARASETAEARKLRENRMKGDEAARRAQENQNRAQERLRTAIKILMGSKTEIKPSRPSNHQKEDSSSLTGSWPGIRS